MARFKSVLIGKAKGSVGDVTLTSWKGINVAKEKATTVSNPRTAGQVAQRSRFARIVALYRLISTVVSLGYKQQAIGKSEFNAFTSDNLVNGSITIVNGVATLDRSKLQIAKGTIPSTLITDASFNNGTNEVNISFSNAVGFGQSDQDRAIALVLSADGTKAAISPLDVSRQGGVLDVSLANTGVNGAQSTTYLFFYNELTGKCSDSVSMVTQ